MPQSLAKVYLHLTFSTKDRARVLLDDHRPRLHAYMGGILRSMGFHPVEINSEPDHAHVLLDLSRTLTIADMVRDLKRGSSIWLQDSFPRLGNFHWQSGYGIFSVSRGDLGQTIHYIRNQREHHRGISFQDEFRRLCKEHEIEIDERYVWD